MSQEAINTLVMLLRMSSSYLNLAADALALGKSEVGKEFFESGIERINQFNDLIAEFQNNNE